MPHESHVTNGPVVLKKTNFVSKDPLTILRFAYAVDPAEVHARFAEAGILIKDESDLVVIAELWKSGGDKAGALRNPNTSQPVVFDSESVFSSIEISNAGLAKAGSKVKFI